MSKAKPLPLPDITTPEDVKAFVDFFYADILQDDLLRPIFVDVAEVNWDEHLPIMYSFWSSMLLGARTYKGQPFPVHAELQSHLTAAHFTRWVQLFDHAIDTLYSGEMAEIAKQRARNIALIFQSKLGLSSEIFGMAP